MTSFRTANFQSTRDLRLTAELISLVARKVEDGGPAPGVVVHSDADYEASLQALLAAGPWHVRVSRIWLRSNGMDAPTHNGIEVPQWKCWPPLN